MPESAAEARPPHGAAASVPTEADLAHAVYRAARAAVADLFREYPGHTFYYCVLVTPGEAYGPALSAWSTEALAEAAHRTGADPDALRWSYADSPFCCYGERYLAPVRELFDARPQVFELPEEDGDSEYELRLRAMETAVARLDRDGLFGSGAQRAAVLVNVEVVPGDSGNTARATRLNPPAALSRWLAEAAEPADE
ncbi:DUF4303 domain-containing protein [Marinactinospora rubrisoli]|uniref:DUF4303 domain-containing protein n=1 Tax=Marinactinospora rubrisoli TaxID=2715399 RepID=A0ABW2KL75_9ACTN